MKKKYIKPVITRVKLDPEQAILQACIIGGIYFAGGAVDCMSASMAGTTHITCATTVKGTKTGSAQSIAGVGYDMPS